MLPGPPHYRVQGEVAPAVPRESQGATEPMIITTGDEPTSFTTVSSGQPFLSLFLILSSCQKRCFVERIQLSKYILGLLISEHWKTILYCCSHMIHNSDCVCITDDTHRGGSMVAIMTLRHPVEKELR